MSGYLLQLAKAAETDLEGIADYIAIELQELTTAQNQIARIKVAILSLQEMPERHSFVADKYLAAKGIRMIPVDNYLVFYVVDKGKRTVNILRVLYGRREWQNIL